MAESELPPVVVRRARWDDVALFCALRLQWQNEEPSPEFEYRFTGWFEREWPSRWWWLALDDQRPVGMVNLKLFHRMPTAQDTTASWGYLCNLFVSPTHRTQGVGGSLVGALLAVAQDHDLVRVVLSPSEESVPLYQRHGFTDAHGLLAWYPQVAGPGR